MVHPLLLLLLLLGGIVTLLMHSGVLSRGRGARAPEVAPVCPAALNHWADQRLEQIRVELQKQHGQRAGSSMGANPASDALGWVEERILAQRLDSERQQIRSRLLSASRCQVQFQP